MTFYNTPMPNEILVHDHHGPCDYMLSPDHDYVWIRVDNVAIAIHRQKHNLYLEYHPASLSGMGPIMGSTAFLWDDVPEIPGHLQPQDDYPDIEEPTVRGEVF